MEQAKRLLIISLFLGFLVWGVYLTVVPFTGKPSNEYDLPNVNQAGITVEQRGNGDSAPTFNSYHDLNK